MARLTEVDPQVGVGDASRSMASGTYFAIETADIPQVYVTVDDNGTISNCKMNIIGRGPRRIRGVSEGAWRPARYAPPVGAMVHL